jgi:RNA polymerase sigma-70 factor (ECF subfamily)
MPESMELSINRALGEVEAPLASAVAQDPALVTRLAEKAVAAAAEWPGVKLDDATYARWLLAHLPSEGDCADAVEDLEAGDLYLTCALAAGNPAALFAFERDFLSAVPSYVSRFERDPAFGDEVTAALRERLLVARGDGPPRIAQYAGRGPLAAFVRIAATRTALNLLDARGRVARESDDDRIGDLEAPLLDPEMSYIKDQYRAEFYRAFREALGELDAEERTMVRMHHLDGLTIDELAALHRIHRATAARRVGRCRQKILDATCRRLRERLNLREPELDSLLGVARSHFQLSIAGLLSR